LRALAASINTGIIAESGRISVAPETPGGETSGYRRLSFFQTPKRFLQSQVNKVNRRKEFFRVKLCEIRGVVEEMKYEARWTIASEATQYRETLALERKLQDDPAFRSRWLEEQSVYESGFVADEDSDELFEDDEAPAYAEQAHTSV
jgi:hypothetical protein